MVRKQLRSNSLLSRFYNFDSTEIKVPLKKKRAKKQTLLSSIANIIYCSDNSFANSADRISICIFSSATIFSSGACEKGTEN